MKSFVLFLSIALICSCTGSRQVVSGTAITELKYLDSYEVPYNFSFRNTTVGGLSGIDFDRRSNTYYIISDDRSDNNPARFYTADIRVANDKIDTVEFRSAHFLLAPNGKNFPDSKTNIFETPDPEAIRFYGPNKIIWTSEGERLIRNGNSPVLRDPFIYIADTTGRFLDSFLLPSLYHMNAAEKGPRRNGVFEGASFNPDQKKLFVNIEEPLYEDGPRAGTKDSTGIIRILQFDAATKKFEKDFAYTIDPVAHEPNPFSAFKINGVPDIFALNDHELLIVERSFSTGRIPCTIKVFLTDLRSSQPINNRNINSVQPLTKKLLLNMDALGIYTDNIEGVCWGPQLQNGNRSLIFIGDNNFSKTQRTQFLLFELRTQ